jgi:predicted nucleic acid-binding protein
MELYADSSFLVSCYIVDANTAKAKAWLSKTGSRLPFTALHALEMQNAFQLGVFRGLLSAAAAAAAWANVEEDLHSGRLVKTAVSWPAAFLMAVKMSKQHSAVTGTRSLDILHLAAAKTLQAAKVASFDARQRALVAAIGLTLAL